MLSPLRSEKNHFVTWPVFYQNVVLQESNVIRWKNLTTAKRNLIMLQIKKKKTNKTKQNKKRKNEKKKNRFHEKVAEMSWEAHVYVRLRLKSGHL